MAPDSDFAPGELRHLVAGNPGRMLDRRRTPIRVAGLEPETGVWICEVMGFEDRGARWELPFESVGHFQFAREAATASTSAVRRFRAAVRKHDHTVHKPLNKRRRKPTARRIADLRREAGEWLASHSELHGTGASLDLGTREGNPLLWRDLEGFMRWRGLWELEHRFASTFVSNPGSGEIVKIHSMVIADLGLADYHGKVIRDPKWLEPPWTWNAREDHVLARLAFVREVFSAAGHQSVVLYRGLSSEEPLRPRTPQTFVSASFSREVAMSLFGEAGDGRHAALYRQRVPIERLFMTYLETAAMNRQFKEAEAVLLDQPGAPLF